MAFGEGASGSKSQSIGNRRGRTSFNDLFTLPWHFGRAHGDAAMHDDKKRLSVGRRSDKERRSGVDTRSDEERRLVGERRSNQDRRSGLDRRSNTAEPMTSGPHKH